MLKETALEFLAKFLTLVIGATILISLVQISSDYFRVKHIKKLCERYVDENYDCVVKLKDIF